MSKGDSKSGYDQWKEYFEKRRIEMGLKKKKGPFFFKWQKLIIWFLGGGMGLAAAISRLVRSGGFYPSLGVVLDLIFPILTSMLFVLIPMAIGNAIYYSAQKKKKATAKTPQVGIADEIRKFKELLDDGAITQEEFDKKKKSLLG